MKILSYNQAFLHSFDVSFEFDDLSYKLRSSFKEHGILLRSNFAIGNNIEGLPPELPRIQLSDEVGFCNITVSLSRVDFKLDCSSKIVEFEEFSVLANTVKYVINELGQEPIRVGMASTSLIENENANNYIKSHLFNDNNAFLQGEFLSSSISVTDYPIFNEGRSLGRTTSINSAYQVHDDKRIQEYIVFSRDINNFLTDLTVPFAFYDKFVTFFKEHTSEKEINKVLGLKNE